MCADQAVKTAFSSATKKKHESHPSEVFFQAMEIITHILIWFIKVIYFVCEDIFRCFSPKVPKAVDKEVVLITGTGHGIGKQLALKYAEAGAIVVGWDSNEENNEITINEIKERYGEKAYGYKCDVSNLKQMEVTARKVKEDVGEVTIVIANAGILYCRHVQDYSPEELKKIMDVNVMQLLWLIHLYLPVMQKNNYGHIVGISSVAGLYASRNMVPYSGSKYAVRGIMEGLREEIRFDRSNKVKTTVIYPYMVNTGFFKASTNRFHHILRILEPEEVAEKIMMAQRTEREEVSIPERLRVINNITRVLPRKAFIRLMDLLGACVEPDPTEHF